MAKYSNTKAKINEKITTNRAQAVTGSILNDVLQTMVDSLGADYQFGGLVQPGSSFTAGEQPVVFLATTPGTYTNFGGLVVADGEVALLVWSGSAWSKQTPDIATRTEVGQLGQDMDNNYVAKEREFGQYVSEDVKHFYITDEDGNVCFKTELDGTIDLSKIAFFSQSGVSYITDGDGNICLKITKEGLIKLNMTIDSFVENFNKSKNRLDLEPDKKDYDFMFPLSVLGIESGSASGREYFTNIYPEGCMKSRLPLKLNGNKKYLFQKIKNTQTTSVAVQSETKTLLLSGDGYKTKTFNVKYVRANRKNAQNKNIFVLCLGDSITAQEYYLKYLSRFVAMDNKDISNIHFLELGTRNISEETIEYDGSTLSCPTRGEGVAGWSTVGYLMYPMQVGIGLSLGAEAMYYASGLATKTPYDSSTPGQEYTAYSDTDAVNQMVAETPCGRYKPDCNETLWNALHNTYKNIFRTGVHSMWYYSTGVDYVSGAQIPAYDSETSPTAINNFLNALMDAPDNPFYDKDRARDYTGSHSWSNTNAFSIDKWIERYRTRTDSGVKLDLADENIGTMITADNINYEVCTPTHIVVGLGTNDFKKGTYTADNSSATEYMFQKAITDLINTIKAQCQSAQIGAFYPRRPGVAIQQDWNEYGLQREIAAFPYAKALVVQNLLGDLNINNQANYIPAYYTASPVSSSGYQSYAYDFDDIDMVKKSVSGNDDIHPSEYWHRGVAYQILAWIYWTLQ